MATWRVIEGDCIEAMRAMDEASVDAVVCDPPYGLSAEQNTAEVLKHWLAGDDYQHRGGGFMGRTWDSFVPGPAVWREAMRVLKPGGHLLAFFGTRTYDLGVIAVRLAGFEIRDTIAWMYGSGFPKSLDVSKAIDRAAGADREPGIEGPYAPRRPRAEVAATNAYHDGVGDYGSALITTPATPEAERWQGWGTALKPAHEPIVVARKPLIGTVALNVTRHGTGALNVDGCRVDAGARPLRVNAGLPDPTGDGYGAKHGSTAEGLTDAGRWPANVILSHSPGCREVGTRKVRGDNRSTGNGSRPSGFANIGAANGDGESNASVYGDTDAPAWECEPGCAVRMLDEQTGSLTSGSGPLNRNADKFRSTYGEFKGDDEAADVLYGDTGGASRFFYVAKASSAERNAGLDGFEATLAKSTESSHASVCAKCNRQRVNIRGACACAEPEWVRVQQRPQRNVHPTVKPIALMQYLVRLVTPPGGTVLDPFAGSGTTIIATVREGFNAIGIEREIEYAAIARARITWWAAQPRDLDLDRCLAGDKRRAKVADEGQTSMFDDAA